MDWIIKANFRSLLVIPEDKKDGNHGLRCAIARLLVRNVCKIERQRRAGTQQGKNLPSPESASGPFASDLVSLLPGNSPRQREPVAHE